MIDGECSITCGECEQTANLFDFCESRLGIELARDEFQCPNCGYHFKVVNVGTATVTDSGFVIPPDRKIEPQTDPFL
jgi:uncharacterized ferredoxin-like protein